MAAANGEEWDVNFDDWQDGYAFEEDVVLQQELNQELNPGDNDSDESLSQSESGGSSDEGSDEPSGLVPPPVVHAARRVLSDAEATVAYDDSWLMPFDREHGPLIHDDHSTPFEIFLSFFTPAVWTLLCDETNRFYEYTLRAKGGLDLLSPSSRMRGWKVVEPDEMKAFVGLVMLMSIDHRNAYESYWSEWKLLHIPEFKKVMTRDRFLSILTFLHFSDNEIPTADKLFKVRGLLDLLITEWKRAFYPDRDVCLDESMIAFKGRTGFTVYQQKKPHKWGMQAYAVSDSKSGYVYNLDIYCGKRLTVDGVGVTHATVLEMVKTEDKNVLVGETIQAA
jgi:hypothetical protein